MIITLKNLISNAKKYEITFTTISGNKYVYSSFDGELEIKNTILLLKQEGKICILDSNKIEGIDFESIH